MPASDSNDGSDGNTFNAIKAREFARGAKTGAPLRRPWDEYDPAEKPDAKRPFSLRLNRHDKAIVRQLAAWRETSLQQAVVAVLREAALREIAERERPKKKA